MTTSVHPSFPQASAAVEELVAQHVHAKDEPVLLAVYYAPARDPADIFLFEIFDGFGRNAVDADRNLFEVTYGNREGFPLASGQALHMVMTNVPEFERASHEDWHHVQELRDAVRRGDFRVVHAAPAYQDLRSTLSV